MDIRTASELLSELNLKTQVDNYIVEVKHFRVADMSTVNLVNSHKHSSYEYHIIKSGICRVTLASGTFDASEGEFYLTAPGVYHEQKAISSGGYIEYSLNCEINLEEPCESEMNTIVRLLTETECKSFKDTQNIIKLFEEALYEAYHKNIGFYISIKNLITSIIIRSARAMSSNRLAPSELSHNSISSIYKDNDFRLIQIERFIEDNLAVKLTADDIARYMCLSNKQICRIIKEKTGRGTKGLILSMKLKKAKELLEETNFSLKNISNSLGLESEIYFNQFFKRKEGITPGNYRENIKIATTSI
ncbi:MAG TPA: AraC family transcriptional regulator [Clostridiaceae bacterium]